MSTLSFTKKDAEDLIRAYSTPDVIAQRKATLEILGLKAGERVLDAGSGPGFLSEAMAEQVGPSGHVHGIDISPDLIAISRGRIPPPQLTYAEESALVTSADDVSFDAVVSTQVAEYIEDTSALLAEFHRVLRPGGRVLIMTTDWACVGWYSENPERMDMMMKAWAGHCPHGSLPRVLGAAMVSAGFGRPQISTHPIINTTFHEQAYSFGAAKLMQSYAEKAGVAAETAAAWFDELTRLNEAGRYYFSTMRTIFTAKKPV